MEREFDPRREEVEGLQIPDNEIPQWMEIYREIGMSPEEIDRVLIRLNKTYADVKKPILIDTYFEMVLAELKKEGRGDLTDAQKENLRNALSKSFDRFRKKGIVALGVDWDALEGK